MDTRFDESDADSGVTGTREPSRRYAQPVPVGWLTLWSCLKKSQQRKMRRQRTPPMLSRKGMGDLPSATLGLPQHWAICRSCGLADLWARDCHAQNGVECPLVTKYHHFHYGYPQCHEDDQPYQKYGNHVCNEEEWEKICYWLTGDPTSTEENCGIRS